MASKLPLNQEQEAAADGFFNFLFSADKQMGISGPGGTGKTFLMGHMIDEIMPRYFNTCSMMGIPPEFDEVSMTATTNKASEVLGGATGRQTGTVHSFLRLKVKDDYSTGKQILSKRNDWIVHDKKILFVDECSMIETDLYNMINEGTIKSKIVYVGDHCQMAPILEPLSPVYRNGIQFFELTQPMRTQNPILHAVNNQLRKTVETGEFKPIQIVPGTIDWMDDAAIMAQIDQDFMTQGHNHRILAWSNNRVIQFNDHIRSIRNLPDEYQVGEILVNATAIQLPKYMLSVEEEVEIYSVSDKVETDLIDGQAELLFREAMIKTKFGGLLSVKLPIDRAHFLGLMDYYRKQKNWAVYFSSLKNKYPDLRPRDAATVYKAQGSSLDTTYIDLGNISTCNNASQVARMLYVAFSRARNRIILYGQLAQKYGGLIF